MISVDIYRAFDEAMFLLQASRPELVRRDQIDVYVTPDALVAFRAGMSDKQAEQDWSEAWDAKPPRLAFRGIRIHQDPDGSDAPTLHWCGAPVLTMAWLDPRHTNVETRVEFAPVNSYPQMKAYECVALRWFEMEPRRSGVPSLQVPVQGTREVVDGARLLELGMVQRDACAGGAYRWTLTRQGENALRQFDVFVALKVAA